jgi:hypothetical protein
MTHLGIFWLVYEVLTFGFFVILAQFSDTKTDIRADAKLESKIDAKPLTGDQKPIDPNNNPKK